jgi:predicted transposase YbfD/YdcC
VISALMPAQFLDCFVSWVNELRAADGKDVLAIDGKALRRSHDGNRTSALHRVSVWSCKNRLVLGQSRSVGKKNEIETVMALLELIELQGATVTLDAMSCQRKIAKKIVGKRADYVISLKSNQGNLHRQVKAYFAHTHREAPELIKAGQTETTDGDHGRVEVRRYRQLAITDWLDEAQGWAGASSVIEVERERHVDEGVTTQTQYYLSSLAVDPVQAAETIRSHWGVENQVHWVLDVTFKEDECRIRRHHGAENMAMVRRFCMNLARLNTTKNSMRGKLKNAGWNDAFRAELLFG